MPGADPHRLDRCPVESMGAVVRAARRPGARRRAAGRPSCCRARLRGVLFRAVPCLPSNRFLPSCSSTAPASTSGATPKAISASLGSTSAAPAVYPDDDARCRLVLQAARVRDPQGDGCAGSTRGAVAPPLDPERGRARSSATACGEHAAADRRSDAAARLGRLLPACAAASGSRFFAGRGDWRRWSRHRLSPICRAPTCASCVGTSRCSSISARATSAAGVVRRPRRPAARAPPVDLALHSCCAALPYSERRSAFGFSSRSRGRISGRDQRGRPHRRRRAPLRLPDRLLRVSWPLGDMNRLATQRQRRSHRRRLRRRAARCRRGWPDYDARADRLPRSATCSLMSARRA